MIDWRRVANTFEAATSLLLFYASIVILGLVLLAMHGCARVDFSGGSTHSIEGEATVRVVVGVDTTPCDKLPAEDQVECIKALVELAEVLQEKDKPTAFEGI